MLMPGRKYSIANTSYRYGFNGKENDNEVKGEGNQQDYGMRIYDPRLGKFLSVDPITKQYPELSAYQFASNRPIQGIDLDGKEVLLVTGNIDGFYLFAGGGIGGGFAIGREGLALYSAETIRGGAGLELGASVNVTVYPKMHNLKDLDGYAPGFSIGGGQGLITAVSVNSSNGKWGAGLSGGPGVGVHASAELGLTIALKVIKWDQLVSFMQSSGEEGKQLMKQFGITDKNVENSVDIIKSFYTKTVRELTNQRISYLSKKNMKNQKEIEGTTDFLNDYKKSGLIYKIGAYLTKKTFQQEKKSAEEDIRKNNIEIKDLKTSLNRN